MRVFTSVIFIAFLVTNAVGQNVGIDVASPNEKLHLLGNLKLQGFPASLYFHKTATSPVAAVTAGPNGLQINVPGSSPIWFSTNGADRMYIDMTGKVGIGTSSPQDFLHVVGHARIQDSIPTLKFYDDGNFSAFIEEHDSTLSITNLRNGRIYFSTNNEQRMVIDSLGRVGIGIDEPEEQLEINGIAALRGSLGALRFKNQFGALYGTLFQSGNVMTLMNYRPNNLNFGTDGDIRMRILSTGNVAIGGTFAHERLHVHGSIKLVDPVAKVILSRLGVDGGYLSQEMDTLSLHNPLDGELRIGVGSDVAMKIFPSGNVGIGVDSAIDNLHINNTVRIDHPTTPRIKFHQDDTFAGFLQISGTNMALSNQLSGDLAFRTSNVTYMTLKSSGFLGLGLTNPVDKLHVAGDIRLEGSDPALKFYSGGTFLGNLEYTPGELALGCTGGDVLALKNGGSFGLRVYANGSVALGLGELFVDNVNHRIGIGTVTPVAKLEVDGGDVIIDDASPRLSLYVSGSNASYLEQTSSTMRIRNMMNGSLILGTNNSDDVTINSLGRVGIGTNAPMHKLDVHSTEERSLNVLNSYAGASDKYGIRSEVNPSGTGSRYAIYASAPNTTDSWALWSAGKAHFTSAVRVGHTEEVVGYMLSVDGKIIGEEIKVQLSEAWPDYVFSEKYNLKTPGEIEEYIIRNGHLPGVPSAFDVNAANGIELGEMNRILLEKIEELTLLLIEQDKRIQQLESRG